MRAPGHRRLLRLLSWLPVLAGLVMLLLSPEAFGRAGGGGHFSGGGFHSFSGGGFHSHFGGGFHSYSGGGGGGFGLFELVFWIFQLTFAHPLVMIPLWLVVGYVVYQSRNNLPSVSTPREIDDLEERRLTPRQNVNDSLADLQSRDPAFDPDAFFERVRKMFLEIQEAWFLRNLDPVRAYMSDGVYRRFTTLLSLMQLENQRNGLADGTVLSARLLEVNSTAAFDCLSVSIHATMRDVDVPASFTDQQARDKARHASAKPFTEIWTFIRRRDAKSKAPGIDASQGKCPSCGAPFSGGAANKCQYCGAIVNSGNYDWVLTEITQDSEYLPHNIAAPGFGSLSEKDPDAAAEILQDRGLLLFWKWLEAWAFAEPTRIQKLATGAGLAGLTEDVNQMKARGASMLVRLAAVGGTAIAAVEMDVNGFDRVHVDIRWSAVMTTTRMPGFRSPTPYRSILTMVRSSDAKTDRGTGLSNERCGNCGAPLTNSDSTRCDYCGHDLAAAAKEWQFESLVPIEQWQRPGTSAYVPHQGNVVAFATASERLRLMRVMVAIVKADGVVEDSEVRLLKDCAGKWRVDWSDVEAMLNEDEQSLLHDVRPQAPEHARAFLRQLIAAAKVDGRIDRRERMLIYRAGVKMQMNTSEIDALLADA